MLLYAVYGGEIVLFMIFLSVRLNRILSLEVQMTSRKSIICFGNGLDNAPEFSYSNSFRPRKLLLVSSICRELLFAIKCDTKQLRF